MVKSDLKRDVIDYVLGKFSKSELDLIDFQKINNAILDFINNDFMYVMNKYNGKCNQKNLQRDFIGRLFP